MKKHHTKPAAAKEFEAWMAEAREIAFEHFTGSGDPATRDRNIVEIAKTMMLADRLGKLETSVSDLRNSLNTSET